MSKRITNLHIEKLKGLENLVSIQPLFWWYEI